MAHHREIIRNLGTCCNLEGFVYAGHELVQPIGSQRMPNFESWTELSVFKCKSTASPRSLPGKAATRLV